MSDLIVSQSPLFESIPLTNSNASPSDSPESRAKVAEWMRGLGGLSPAQRFVDCGCEGRGWLGRCPEGHFLFHSFRCTLRICPRCSFAASRKLADKLTPAIQEKVRAAPLDWSLKHFMFSTNISLLDYTKIVDGRLLLAPLVALQKKTKELRAALARMFKDKFIDVEGVGFGIGIEFGENLMLHFHVLALCPFWKQEEFGRSGGMWEQYNGGVGYVATVRAVDTDANAIEKSVGYVSKYITKPLSSKKSERKEPTAQALRVAAFVSEHGFECVTAAMWGFFKGMRRFQTYGDFYHLEFAEDEERVCPVCGGVLDWVSEQDFLAEGNYTPIEQEFLILSKTNKLYSNNVDEPPDDGDFISDNPSSLYYLEVEEGDLSLFLRVGHGNQENYTDVGLRC